MEEGRFAGEGGERDGGKEGGVEKGGKDDISQPGGSIGPSRAVITYCQGKKWLTLIHPPKPCLVYIRGPQRELPAADVLSL